MRGGAGDGNRTRVTCLEGRSSTTELLPLDQRIGRPQHKVKERWRPGLGYEAIAPSRQRADDLAPGARVAEIGPQGSHMGANDVAAAGVGKEAPHLLQ